MNPADFYVIIKNVRYGDAPATFSLHNHLPDTTVLVGETVQWRS